MKTLQEKNTVLRNALMSIDEIAVRYFRDVVGASEEEKYDRGKTAFNEIAKEIANAMRLDLFGDEPPKKSWVARVIEAADKAIQDIEECEPAPAEKKTGNAVGITSNAKHVLAWSYENDCDIRVVGDVCAPGQMQISGYENGKIVLIGSVFGSRWLAIRLARFIRNGLVSHRMKRRRNKANRAARKAAANNPVNPVNPVQNEEAPNA